MTAIFSTKADVKRYLEYFSANDFDQASRYWSPGIKVLLGDRFRIESREENVKFFQEQRRLINEEVVPQTIVLDDSACALRAVVNFTPLQDLPEGFARMPPIKLGQYYQLQYLIMYHLDQSKQIDTIIGERIGEAKIFDI
ncbi:hypothetical protein EDB81DRAFT_143827 [Dactylonectria macrodidyma]|uniref:SnoaL-like domain-containing protein n=1 Tax=Dactylonectria macrodidyma TaxID=307937 RepID=A0A9P9DYE4_9HYPO|nr:hypothetical protein EDB81DRAFT_143827 [Dactylonectria macrodidyma]